MLETQRYVYLRKMTDREAEVICKRAVPATPGTTAPATPGVKSPSESKAEEDRYRRPPVPPPPPPKDDRRDAQDPSKPWEFQRRGFVRVPSGTYSAWPLAGTLLHSCASDSRHRAIARGRA